MEGRISAKMVGYAYSKGKIMTTIQFEYDVLNDHFLSMGAVNSVSELQGMLCGKLSGGKQLNATDWVNEALDFMDLARADLTDDNLALFDMLLCESTADISESKYAFKLLVPDDSSTLNRRVDELGAWCKGYLHGIGTSGLRGDMPLSPDTTEVLRDLAQIANVIVDEDGEMEENEIYWNELVEYVKVAVLNVYTELKSMDLDGADPGTYHPQKDSSWH